MKTEDAIHRLHIAEQEIPDNTINLVPVKNKIQKWAACNAYTLIFLSIMFFITWILLIVTVSRNW